MKIIKSGECKIVSSGYEDRFAHTNSHVTIIVDSIAFTVSLEHACRAIAKLRNLDTEDLDVLAEIGLELAEIPTAYSANYEREDELGRASVTCAVRPEAVRAGILVATNFKNLSEIGIERAKERFAELTLTKEEKEFVIYGLEQINKRHKELGLPIVEINNLE